jgi:maltose/maltodextrin transport system substrate-binding protein
MRTLCCKSFRYASTHGDVMPNIPRMGRFFTVMGAALQTATDGRATAEAALREADVNMRHQ